MGDDTWRAHSQVQDHKPLKDRRTTPEYIDSRGKSWAKPKAS